MIVIAKHCDIILVQFNLPDFTTNMTLVKRLCILL